RRGTRGSAHQERAGHGGMGHRRRSWRSSAWLAAALLISFALVTPAVPSMSGTNAAYSASTSNGANVFSTAASFGGLRQLAGTAGCVSSSGTETACTLLTAGQMGYPRGIVVSPDDKHVYVGS